jgi:succinoglycan biosynthesis protein ExoA
VRTPFPDARTATTPSSDPEALVSVVVPARDEERTLGDCLASILGQTETRLQVIVVDGGSSDRTLAIVEEMASSDPRLESIRFGVASIPGALNAALRRANGRWLVRVDAHSTIPSDYVRTSVAHLETGRWGGVGGRKDAVASTSAGRAIAAAMGSRFGVGNSVYHHGSRSRIVDHVPFGAYATESLRRLGGWDERLTANEDFELDRRIRSSEGPLLFDPDLRIEWRCRESIGALFRQYVRYGRGKADVAMLHPRSLRPRHLAPPALVIALVVAALASVAAPGVALAIAGPYGVVLIVASAVTARRVRGAAARAWLPAAFAAMHVGWGIGSIIGAVAGATGRGPRQRGDPPVPLDRSVTENAEQGPEQTLDGGNTSGEPSDDRKVRRIA